MGEATVINIFGGPGIGKSSVAAGLFAEMKRRHHSVELVTEYVKIPAYEGRDAVFRNQLYILAKQHWSVELLRDKVDYIVTDCPILMGAAYAPDQYYESYLPLVVEVHNSFSNINILLRRSQFNTYQEEGRVHSFEDAVEKDRQIRKMVQTHAKGPVVEVDMAEDRPVHTVINIVNSYLSVEKKAVPA